MIKWARLAVDQAPYAWHSHVAGAAHYRAGDCSEAVRWLDVSLAQQWVPAGRAQNQFMLAMSYFRLGEKARARALLDEAVRWCEESEASRDRGVVSSVVASDWLTIQLYRREAESLFRDRGIPDDPFARGTGPVSRRESSGP